MDLQGKPCGAGVPARQVRPAAADGEVRAVDSDQLSDPAAVERYLAKA
jgi:hypothetical protein